MHVFVSGSNRGIGKEIVEILRKRVDVNKIYAGTRNKDIPILEKDSVENNERLSKVKNVYFDVNKQCIDQSFFQNFEKTKLDVLINNSAINKNKEENKQQVIDILQTNFLNTIKFTENCIKNDVMEKNSIILNVGSLYGTLRGIQDKNIAQKIYNAQTKQDLINLAEQYIQDWPKKYYIKGWPCQTYSFSKVLLYFYTKLLSRRENILQKNIQIYCVHPKWVKTDMGGKSAPESAFVGAQSILVPIDFERKINPNLQGKMLYNGITDLQNYLKLQIIQFFSLHNINQLLFWYIQKLESQYTFLIVYDIYQMFRRLNDNLYSSSDTQTEKDESFDPTMENAQIRQTNAKKMKKLAQSFILFINQLNCILKRY